MYLGESKLMPATHFTSKMYSKIRCTDRWIKGYICNKAIVVKC